MNIEIEYVCPAKPKFRVGDVVTIPEASPEITYVIRESIDFGPSTGIVYEIFAPDNTERIIQFAESGLEFQYHDTSWEYYLNESVRNGLPAWRGKLYNLFACYLDFNYKNGIFDSSEVKERENDTIPVQFMEHIIKKHSVYGMINRVLGNRCTTESAVKIRELFKLSLEDIVEIRRSMLSELDDINATGADRRYHNKYKNSDLFKDNEWDILLQIDKLDVVKGVHVDHYPATMTNLHIMEAIKEAYESAHKEGAIEIGRDRDLRTGENITEVKGHQKYVGRSVTHDISICFLYSRDMNLITTAYPTSDYIDYNAKKH